MGPSPMISEQSQDQGPRCAALDRVWLNGGAAIFNLSLARHAFTLIAMSALDERDARRGLRFWCPAFFCNRALGPLRRTGAELVLYPVGGDMAPDWAECEKLAAGQPPDLFMLVHYFGQCNAVDEARAFCDRTGAKLIEDAAHLMGPAGRIGSAGDFVCYQAGPAEAFRKQPDG